MIKQLIFTHFPKYDSGSACCIIKLCRTLMKDSSGAFPLLLVFPTLPSPVCFDDIMSLNNDRLPLMASSAVFAGKSMMAENTWSKVRWPYRYAVHQVIATWQICNKTHQMLWQLLHSGIKTLLNTHKHRQYLADKTAIHMLLWRGVCIYVCWYLRWPLDRRMMFSRKVFWGATSPRLAPGMLVEVTP